MGRDGKNSRDPIGHPSSGSGVITRALETIGKRLKNRSIACFILTTRILVIRNSMSISGDLESIYYLRA
jgi:hypothetical protein